jgi:glycosyltransferase involved in cell wall biosynthesis
MIAHIKLFKPDIVVFDNSRTTAGMLKKVKKLGVKTITIHHNYEMEYYRGTKPSILWRAAFMHFMEKAERTAVQRSDLNLTLTDEDISLLQKHYDPHKTKKIVRLGSFESTTNSISADENQNKSSDNKLCFAITGTLGTYQTEVSVIPFLENEYPELLKILPGSKLIVAGRNPSDKMIIACSIFPSIELIANPENMQEIIAQADVYICPTCVGGGLKLRVMDGLKAGLPVLTHAVSARGYDDFSKANCMFVYENKETFKLSLAKLLKEQSQGNLDSNKIKTIYKSVFSFEAGVNRLNEILFQNAII